MPKLEASNVRIIGNSPDGHDSSVLKSHNVPPVDVGRSEQAVPPSPASEDSMGSIPDDSDMEDACSIPEMNEFDDSENAAIFREEHISELATQVSALLKDIVDKNDRIPFNAERLTRFHSRAPPGISIRDYLVRIIKFCSLDKAILLVILYFVDLFSQSYANFNLNTLTVHRFLITAATVASKGLCDQFCSNTHYAKVGGVSVVELNLLEVEFLTRVQYRIVAPTSLLWQYFLKSQEKPTLTQPANHEGSSSRKHAREDAPAVNAHSVGIPVSQGKSKGLKAMRDTFRFLHSTKKKKEDDTAHV